MLVMLMMMMMMTVQVMEARCGRCLTSARFLTVRYVTCDVIALEFATKVTF